MNSLDRMGLLKHYHLFETHEPEEFRRIAARIFNTAQSSSTITKKKFYFCINHFEFGNVTLSYVVSDTDLEIKAGELSNYYSLFIQKEGRVGHIIDNQKFTTVPGKAVIHSPTQKIVLKASGPAAVLAVRISRVALERSLSSRLNENLHNTLKFFPALDLTTGAGQAIERLIMFICNELDTMNSLMRFSPHSIKHLKQTLITSLLDGQTHNYSHIMRGSLHDTSFDLVRRTEEFIHNNIDEQLSSGTIAAAMGVSERSLYRSFRRHGKSTPMEIFRHERLKRVHVILKTGLPGTTVISAAMNYGFFHLGRFSQYYKSRFGESPSMTLRRAREKL